MTDAVDFGVSFSAQQPKFAVVPVDMAKLSDRLVQYSQQGVLAFQIIMIVDIIQL